MRDFPDCLGTQGKEEYHRIIKTQWASSEQLSADSFQKLQQAIAKSYSAIPFYKSQFEKLGITPSLIRSPEDLSTLPILNKDDLRNHFSDLISTAKTANQIRLSMTSGSTGTPVNFYLTRYVDEIEYAYLWRQWNWAGFDYGDRAVVVRGLRILDSKDENHPYRIDRENGRKNLYISSFHLNEANLHFYLQLMIRFKPKILRAFPSTLDLITRFSKQFGYHIPSIQTIVTASETLLDSVRYQAEDYWKCQIFDWYGQTERVAAFGQCSEGNYHVSQEYSYVELVETTEEGLFEVIGSSFNNEVMPLLRYRIGDIVSGLVKECPCKRGLQAFKKIEGRTSQMLLSTDGRWLFPNSVRYAIDPISNISMAQIIQKNKHSIEVRIVPDKRFNKLDQQQIEILLSGLLGQDIEIQILYVRDTQIGTTGKRPLVISHLPPPFS